MCTIYQGVVSAVVRQNPPDATSSLLAGRSYVVWQEIVDNNVTVAPDTVVHVWKWWWPVDNDTLSGVSHVLAC